MSNFTAKDKKIFEDMKQCLIDFGLNILNESELKISICGLSTFKHSDPRCYMAISFSFQPSQNLIGLSIRYPDVQKEKIPSLYVLFNHININMRLSHFCIDPNVWIDPNYRMMFLNTGLYVTGYFLNKDEFKTLLNELFETSHTFYPLIVNVLTTDQTPQAVMDEFYAANGQILPGFHKEEVL